MATIKLKLQIMCDDAIAVGPGKAALLEQIIAAGSIAGAARNLGLSYRRAWQLVDVMNRCWNTRLVETSPGRARGGARLTAMGLRVLSQYRDLQHNLETSANAGGWHDLVTSLRQTPLLQTPQCEPAEQPVQQDMLPLESLTTA